MVSGLPSLARLSINHPAEQVGASWAWDQGKYGVSFSIDVAVKEQIEGLGKIELESFVPRDGPPGVSQMLPMAVLKVVREHCIQRLWDLHCAVPHLDYVPLPASKSRPDPEEANTGEPFPDKPGDFVRTVAQWMLKVSSTLSANQAKTFETTRASRERARRRAQKEEEEEDEDEGEGEEAEDGEELKAERLEDVIAKITDSISRARSEQGDAEERVLNALLMVEEMFDSVQKSITTVDAEGRRQRDLDVSEFLVRNKDTLTKPGIGEVRLSPTSTWYKPNAKSSRLIRWWKMALVLGEEGDEEIIDGQLFEPSALVPSKVLDGSFYTGDTMRYTEPEPNKRINALTMEHIVPVNHMNNCRLIKECRAPEHLAMITTMATGTENSSRGTTYLPLGKTSRRMNEAMQSGPGLVFKGATQAQFILPRRQAASRMLCAGYLTLPMLERLPDPNTELGAKQGGVYDRFRDDIYDLMLGTVDTGVDTSDPSLLYVPTEDVPGGTLSAFRRKQFRQAWMWEAGLSLLQWAYLEQPYNPLPMMAYRRKVGLDARDGPLPFWKDLLFMRFRNSDMTSEMLRKEMQEEVANAPLGEDLPGPDVLSRTEFIKTLKAEITLTKEDNAKRDARQRQASKRPAPPPGQRENPPSVRRRDGQQGGSSGVRRSERLAKTEPVDTTLK